MDDLLGNRRDSKLSYYQRDLVHLCADYKQNGWTEKPDASYQPPSLITPISNSVKEDSNRPPSYNKNATAKSDPAAVLRENADRLQKFLIHCLSVEYSATSIAELSSEDRRFFLRLSQSIIWHERGSVSSFTSLDHCDPALEHEFLVKSLISDPARYLNVPIEPVKWMIVCYIWCMDTDGRFQGRWNGQFQPSLDQAASKLLLDKDIMIDAVFHNHPNSQLREELHNNLAKIQAKYFISLTTAVEYVPTRLGEHHKPRYERQKAITREFLDFVGERVGLLRYLNAVKTDRTCRRFLQGLLREMDKEDDEAEEENMSHNAILRRRVQRWWKGEEKEEKEGKKIEDKLRYQDYHRGGWVEWRRAGRVAGYGSAFSLGWYAGRSSRDPTVKEIMDSYSRRTRPSSYEVVDEAVDKLVDLGGC